MAEANSSEATMDLREQITRIDRAIAETEKFQAEQRKLIAEERKLTWDRWLAPALAITATFGGVLGVATFIAHLMGR